MKFTQAHTKPGDLRVHVITIAPGVEPANVLSNVCASRVFLTHLVPVIDSAGPTVITIDKTYSEGACTDAAINDAFRSSLNRTHATIVVGESLQPLASPPPGAATTSCQVQAPGFDFRSASPAGKSNIQGTASAHVLKGVTTADTDTLQIPLSWPIYPDQQAASRSEKPKLEFTLALLSARQINPNALPDTSLEKPNQADYNPYGRFVAPGDIPKTSALAVLCASPDAEAVAKHGWGDCRGVSPARLELNGKAALIGDLGPRDMHNFPTGRISGVVLQALYTQALLDHAYLKSLNPDYEFGILLAVLAVSTCLIWSCEEHNWLALGISILTLFFLLALSFSLAEFADIFLALIWYALAGNLASVAGLALYYGYGSVKKMHRAL